MDFHYIENFELLSEKIYSTLKENGDFIFSVEHPVFTAHGTENWVYDAQGNICFWPVDNYFQEGLRKTTFLGETVYKYHKTLTTYIYGLLKAGFQIKELIEPTPEEQMLKEIPEMKEELRRPMMLLISAKK